MNELNKLWCQIAEKTQVGLNEDLITHISPLGWEHINMLGEYQFKFDDNEDKEILRPLNV